VPTSKVKEVAAVPKGIDAQEDGGAAMPDSAACSTSCRLRGAVLLPPT